MNLTRPCHDPIRVDAVLACMVDALHDLAGAAEADNDSPRQSTTAMDLHALADAVCACVDHVALLGLLPLMGADELYGAGLARIVTGKAKANDCASADRALAAVVAVRLTTIAASVAVLVGKPDAQAAALWAAAGRLTGLLTYADDQLLHTQAAMREDAVDLAKAQAECDELRRELEQARADATDLRTELDSVRRGLADYEFETIPPRARPPTRNAAELQTIAERVGPLINEGQIATMERKPGDVARAVRTLAERYEEATSTATTLSRKIFTGECCED